MDIREDRSLSAARLVCVNSGHLLKRKDSSGAILKDGGSYASKINTQFGLFNVEEVVLNPGNEGNKIKVRGKLGDVGTYKVVQLAVKVRVTYFFVNKHSLDCLVHILHFMDDYS